MFTRTQTRELRIGGLPLGGGAPVSVQTMATADPHDAAALIAQIQRCAACGADLVRLTVPDLDAARVLGEVRKTSPVPLVADIHFDYRCALAAIEAGADALRLNPGNIGGAENVRAVARAAQAKGVPIRVGVNAGSLEKGESLVSSALKHVKLLEDEGFRDIAISVKASDVPRTVAAYRELAERTDCPLHLGVTEAGTFLPGTVRSSVALGILLSEGIGDTIRVSLTDEPEREVKVGLEILRALGLRAPGPSVTSCPTCGRTRVDVRAVAEEVEAALEQYGRKGIPLPRVAVMGCAVNGPGEAKDADVALCGGDGEFLLYVHGKPVRKVSPTEAVAAVLAAICTPAPLAPDGRAGARPSRVESRHLGG
ncbi:MAG: flavodoxin-dependent (E)-4-hydroxy-3-methylbut-2-enyl-diphosphate synthase [Kiritimatiellae bacterium]|nr:flavodoxin-dependent (E)-4-hydroxy-3-methylbut-2-enyl-diphosphate synthase [Kiritimatiellia bacterium]